MRIAVSGSIATDHLMTYPGRFVEQLLPDQLATLSVAFLVDGLEIRRGGTGGNIAYGMSQVGRHPVLVGAVGEDISDYVASLAAGGVDTSGVCVAADNSARFVCTTDLDMNQIAAFYPGAMREAGEIDLATLGDLDLIIVSPNDPTAMTRQTEQAVKLGITVFADPSQQISSLDGETLRALLEGPTLLFSNAYEAELLEHKTGWSAAEILAKVGTRVTTLGGDGAKIQRVGEPDLIIPVIPATAKADPTGVGDAFRAGWLSALSEGLPIQRCAELGTLLATLCLEAVGPQGWSLDTPELRTAAADRLAAVHGATSRNDLDTLLRTVGR